VLVWGLKSRPPTQQTDALLSELTKIGRHTVLAAWWAGRRGVAAAVPKFGQVSFWSKKRKLRKFLKRFHSFREITLSLKTANNNIGNQYITRYQEIQYSKVVRVGIFLTPLFIRVSHCH